MPRQTPSDMAPVNTANGHRAVVLLGLIAAPWLIAVGFDLVTLVITEPPAYLTLPWQIRTGPFDEQLDQTDPKGWGDLIRMAGLPRYARIFENGESRVVHRVTDGAGYLNAPTGHATSIKRDITLIGASFMVAGSSPGQLFSQQLANATDLSVYNAAWPGVGPSYAAERLVGQPNFGRDRERIVVWGLAQRSLEAFLFQQLDAMLDSDGRPVPAPSRPGLLAQLGTVLTWTQTLEYYLQHTHKADWLIGWCADFLPPPALDLGFDSLVKLGYAGDPFDRHMLFLGVTIGSARMTFTDRAGPGICSVIEKFRKFCAHRGVRLVVALVPDKYEVFRREVTILNAPTVSPGSKDRISANEPVTTVFARELSGRGVEALDLYGPMTAAQHANAGATLLYRAEDTHWSDAGIDVAARHVAAYLGGRH